MSIFNGRQDVKKKHISMATDKSQQAYERNRDKSKPVENPKLKVYFKRLQQNQTNQHLNQVFNEIVNYAYFLSVIMLTNKPEPNNDGTVAFQKGTIIKFPMLTYGEEKQYYPVFTDWEELLKWNQMENPKTLILSFDDYAAMVINNAEVGGFVINPFGENFIIDRSLAVRLKTKKDIDTKGVSQQVITKETAVTLGEPRRYTTDMVSAVSDFLKHRPDVRRVWLRLMIRDEEQSYLFIAEFAGDKDTLFGEIADAARPYLHGMYLDMVSYQDEFGRDAVKGVQPFYDLKHD